METGPALAVGQAVLGVAVGEVIKPIVERGKKALAFGEILNQVKSILKLIESTVHQTKQLSGEGDRPKEESGKLSQLFEEGQTLIEKYSRCHWLLNNWKYARDVTAFYDKLHDFFKFHIPLKQYTIISEIYKSNREILVGLRPQVKSGEIEHLDPCYAPDPPAFLVGLDEPLREVKERLLKDHAPVVVVSAPGGCGKTTLAQKLCQDTDVKGKFKDNIFYFTVSKVHDIKLMIQKLFDHKRFPVPEFTTDEDAISQLKEQLKKQAPKDPVELLKNKAPNPVLFVFDDVWDEPEFPLQKFVFGPEYKILVTSRYKFPSFGSSHNLDLLNDDDAMKLFRNSAFLTDGDFILDEDFDEELNEDLVHEIVKRCGGFPLALQVVGGSLRGKPVEIWRSRLLELSEGQSIFDSEKRLLDCLQLSLASLDGKLKECFMDLGSFPEDQRIPVTALIDMWAELYKLDKNGVHAISNLQKLSLHNLLNLVVTRKDGTEVERCYDNAFVLQHDLLRDLAIRQSSQEPMEQRKRLILNLIENKLPDWWTEEKQPCIKSRLLSIFTGLLLKLSGNKLPHWWTEEKQPCIKARLLSIFTDESFSSSWCNMQAPEVEVLMLNFQTREKYYTLPGFMKQMDKLKVLVLTNYGSSIPELTNFVVLSSLSSLKRIRLERVSIPTLCNTMVQLKNLEKITLVMCKINQAFNSCAIRIPDMLPNLTEINIDSCNDLEEFPEWLCDLVQLRKLSISNCHKPFALPEGIGKLENLEVLRLDACTELVKLPDSIGSLIKLTFLDISGCIRMSELPEQMGTLNNLGKLCLRRCRSLKQLPPSMEGIKQLKIICDTETAQQWDDHDHNLIILKIEEKPNLDWL